MVARILRVSTSYHRKLQFTICMGAGTSSLLFSICVFLATYTCSHVGVSFSGFRRLHLVPLCSLQISFYCCSSFVLPYHTLHNRIFSPACNFFSTSSRFFDFAS